MSNDATRFSEWWTQVGEAVGERWLGTGRQINSFDAVAAGVLFDHPVPTGDVAPSALSWLARGEVPHQHDVGSGFGQPALTVFEGDGFIVYLLFWFDETFAIHDHRFSGAFTILEGTSLQNVYEFEATQKLSQGIEFGVLRPTKVEIVRPGDVRRIYPGAGLIHSNIHFRYPTPTLSLVVRLLSGGDRPQRFYSHSGFAFAREPLSAVSGMRLQGLAAACRVSAETGAAYLQEILNDAPPDLVLRCLYLAAASGVLSDSEYLLKLTRASVLGSSDHVSSALVDFVHEVERSTLALAYLRRVRSLNDRALLSMVASGTDWELSSGVLQTLCPGLSVCGALWRLVSESIEYIQPSEPAGPCVLTHTASEYVRSRCSAAFDGMSSDVPGDVLTELVTHSIFGPLFQFVLDQGR
jgi:hypothetical protein